MSTRAIHFVLLFLYLIYQDACKVTTLKLQHIFKDACAKLPCFSKRNISELH